ncbi:hypothetical protein SOCEGT47_033950 [Sorangium cellulosum]|uniref:Bestrophin n=1 Tax=Sorangium cellulosum TaxID=56 RepID=A0A4P2Q102_SORCE|nr:bestrophin family ion channel [Sorangium cellulosum]AUX22879.1 hypothetical protein SOCEGT47_033950 [Sorangium cellulosum]
MTCPASDAASPVRPSRSPEQRDSRRFWSDALAWRGAVTPVVLPRVLGFGLYGLAVGLAHEALGWQGLEAGPVHFTGGFLALLLVLRTNAGYERWWEARKLWGGIVNQSRNLAVAGLAYGPADEVWRQRFVRWSAAFPAVARRSLRGERELPDVAALLQSPEEAARLARAGHMPSAVSLRLGALLREALERGAMPSMAFYSAEYERARLIDHVGGCERILKTPMPRVHTIKLRRFLVLYLLVLPPAVAGQLWWTPALVTILVAYPLLAIDQIAVELENPFSKRNLSHLPLEDICSTVEANLLDLLGPEGGRPEAPSPPAAGGPLTGGHALP